VAIASDFATITSDSAAAAIDSAAAADRFGFGPARR
jgi:hypothetical protein